MEVTVTITSKEEGRLPRSFTGPYIHWHEVTLELEGSEKVIMAILKHLKELKVDDIPVKLG